MSDNENKFEHMLLGEFEELMKKAQEGDTESTESLLSFVKYMSQTDEWKELKNLLKEIKKYEAENSSVTIETDEQGNEVFSIDVTRKKSHSFPKDIISGNIFTNPDYAIRYDEPNYTRKISVKDSKGYDMGIALGLKSTSNEEMIEEIKENPLMSLNPFTRIIHDSICDLLTYYNGRMIFTWQELFTNIPSCHGMISPKMLEMIRDEAFPMMRVTTVSVNNKWEAQNGDYVQFIRKAPLLHYEEIEAEIKVSGNISKKGGFRIVETPILLDFARSRGHIMKIDDLVYNVPDMSNTRENLILKDYIVRRVEAMISNHMLSRYIKIETVYEYMRTQNDRRVTERLRKKINQILTHLKSCGYILDYAELRSGNRVTGYEIMLYKKKNNQRLIEVNE